MSPSAYQVGLDLIDATCHEILRLGGSREEASLAPLASYAVLVRRLDYYMERLPRDLEEEGGAEREDDARAAPGASPLRDLGVRRRLLLAQLALRVCARAAYPAATADDADRRGSHPPALIDEPDSWWSQLREKLGHLPRQLQLPGNGPEDPLFEGVRCQAQALEALALLRRNLRAESHRRGDVEGSASHLRYASAKLAEYQAAIADIDKKLGDAGGDEGCRDLFLPQRMLSLDRGPDVAGTAEAATSLLEGIDDLIARRAFPVRRFQVQLSRLLKHWEGSHLSPPSLFATGYFRRGGATAEAPPAAVRASAPPSPATSRVERRDWRRTVAQDVDEYLDSYGPMARHRGRTGGIAADGVPSSGNHGGNELRSAATPASPASARGGRRSGLGSGPPLGSPSSLWSPSSSAGGTPGKRKRRVPYTEAEKRALVEGVARCGVGEWKEILAHGKDVFQPNGRTNVNLKDLYRTMEKKGEV